MDEEWTVNANEVITISLVAPTEDGLTRLESFNPKFTYPIFGEEETIFGYKGLKVNLQYHASDLRPNLTVGSIRKFKAVGEVEPVDVVGTLKEYLPEVAFKKKEDFELQTKQVPENWTPPGELVRTIERDGQVYEVWKGNLADAKVKQLINRIQILALLYIEGGSFIGKDDEGNDAPDYSLVRWSVFFLYKKTTDTGKAGSNRYVFQGYSTVYHFWMYGPPTPPASPGKESEAPQTKDNDSWELPRGDTSCTEIPHRARISQFLILPPFQGKGAGAMLYSTIFDLHAKDGRTKEITVEDPNEEFDMLRDLCDMKYIRKNIPEFADLKVNAHISLPEKGGSLRHDTRISFPEDGVTSSKGIVDIEALEKLRQRVKIAPRQFSRLVEMHLMSQLPNSVRPKPDDDEEEVAASKQDKNTYTLWRLLLKQRLYRRNASFLGDFDITERIIKLNETLANVEWEYAAILQRLEAPRPADAKNGKRKADDIAENGSPVSKKARVENA